ncbi:MAG: hypothetical protein B7Z40_04510 [Bosea sp. 12-68-7]|nr:MAG: hypothetical protein B7Z40_04510 [Bosea sp. 12-68-7]OYW98122.1 MAG: hypothetical protein B7Z14_15770 [Bosea sp. 32-68-6]
MGQVLVRGVHDETIDAYRDKARLNNRSLEEELRCLLEANRPYTAAERMAVSQAARARYTAIQPSLTLDEIREGLE